MGKATTELKVVSESREKAEGSLAKLGAAGDKMKEEVHTKVVELQVSLPASPSVLTCQVKAQKLLEDTPDTELDTLFDTVSSKVAKLETTTTSLGSSLTVLKTDLTTLVTTNRTQVDTEINGIFSQVEKLDSSTATIKTDLRASC